MSRILPRVLLVGLVAAMIFTTAGCSTTRVRRSMDMRIEHLVGRALEVRSSNGPIEVHVEPDRTDVHVEAVLTCGGGTRGEAERRCDAASVGAERNDDGTLAVEPVFPGGRRDGDGARLVVRVPDVDGLVVDTSNGHVRIDGGTAGTLVASTANGSITLDDHAGPVRLATSNGSVTATGIAGTADIDTSNGSVTASLTPDQPGPVDIRTSNGGIRLTVGPAFTGRVTMSTSNGGVAVSDRAGIARQIRTEGQDGVIVIDDDGPHSTVRTANGRIRIVIEAPDGGG